MRTTKETVATTEETITIETVGKEAVVGRLPEEKAIALFIEEIEAQAVEQFIAAMNQPYAKMGALMPDAHTGYALPIGAVVATDGVIVPAWVGYDIGCGVYGVLTSWTKEEIEANSDDIFQDIYSVLPVGYKHRKRSKSWHLYHDLDKTGEFHRMFMEKGGFKQLGTLGGGNHMVEIAYDEEERVWIVIHSGSRNVGHATATHYMRLASPDDKVREGHYGFAVDSVYGKNYIKDLHVCLMFALKNRELIAEEVIAVIDKYTPGGAINKSINRNHNHAELREIDGKEYWIHRKGATHAEEGMYGIIPGNMRDGSFIARGKGNRDALFSSSHGAGRVMSRRKARSSIALDAFRSTMSGIKARVSSSTIDESPMAYKNIFEVMKMQKDLVEIVAHLKPIINIKG